MDIARQKNSHIKNIIGRSLLVSSILTLTIALIGSIYFNRSGLQMLRESNLKKEQQLLSNFLVPAIAIADVMEVRRLLGLASDKNDKFAVIDNSGDILISNYEDFSLVRKSYIGQIKSINCSMVKTGYQLINDQKFWINCFPLVANDFEGKHNVGILISYSSYFSFWFSSLVFYFFGLALLSLLLNALWFRRVLHKRLLNPLTALGSKIVEIARSPFGSEACLEEVRDLPHEINEIKNAFQNVLAHLQLEYQQRTESEKKSALLDQAARVAHDIRSPIAAMEMSLHMFAKEVSSEDILIMKMAIQSVRDIANNLLSKYRDNQLDASKEVMSSASDDYNVLRPVLLCSLIEQVISQKRYEWLQNKCELTFNYESKVKSVWINVVPNDVKRMMSNLLNNAIEACMESPKIDVRLNEINNYLVLCIIDNGLGIPFEKIDKVLGGESSKHTGKGLGLAGAKQYMESIGGTLSLASTLNKGTAITLTFKINAKPIWYPKNICLSSYETIIVLDDDTAMQALWIHRLQSYPIKLRLFSKYEEAFQWMENNIESLDKTIFLIDYELSEESITGLDLLKYFNVSQNGYLVTSYAEEVKIQKEIEEMRIWLIPKTLTSDISIQI